METTIIIRTFHNPIPAQMTSGKLREAGIENYLVGEDAIQTLNISNSPGGAIKLIVNKADEQDARQLLYEFDEAYRKSARCESCASNEIYLVEKAEPMGSLMSFLQRFISVNPDIRQVYVCKNCGRETDELPIPPEESTKKDLL
jgi:hypothetical protein